MKVEPDLTIPGHLEIFVVGDLMSLGGLPGVAQVAIQLGRHAATAIRGRAQRVITAQQVFARRALEQQPTMIPTVHAVGAPKPPLGTSTQDEGSMLRVVEAPERLRNSVAGES